MEEKIIQITAGHGPLECQWVVAKVLKVFLQEATQKGIDYTIVSREEGDANLTIKSVTVQLKGKELSAFLKNWLGTVCWVGKSTFRKFHQRRNWYIGIFELDQLQRQPFSERDVQFQTTRFSNLPSKRKTIGIITPKCSGAILCAPLMALISKALM